MKQAATYSSLTGKDAVSTSGNGGTTWRIYEGCTTPLLSSFFKGVATVGTAAGATSEYNGQEQTADVSQLVFEPALSDTSHIHSAGGGTNVGSYNFNIYSDQQGYDLVNTNTLTINPKTITGSLASGYSFDKVYDGTTTATLGNGYTLNGVVAGDNVPLTAVKGFYDSNAVGDRTVTFSGFSINDVNYLLSMADSLSGIGKITSNGNTNNNTNGFSDHNYSDALIGVRQYY